jgi:hypothetical protein
MRKFGIIAVLSLLVTALAAVPALAAGDPVFNAAAAPQGTSLQQNSPAPSCTLVTGTQNVTCNSFELTGVGNTDATVSLTATYTATIDCRNNGGKIVAVKTGTFTAAPVSADAEAKNGRLTAPSLTVTAPSAADFIAQQTCPNPNWTPEVQQGTTITLVPGSSVYTLTFDGFEDPYITIIDP